MRTKALPVDRRGSPQGAPAPVNPRRPTLRNPCRKKGVGQRGVGHTPGQATQIAVAPIAGTSPNLYDCQGENGSRVETHRLEPSRST
jgi:hypothetical protein